MQRRSWRPAIKGSPQAPACIRAEFEIAVKGKFDRIGYCNNRRFLKPNAVLNSTQIQYNVPPVRALPQLTFIHVAEVQTDVRMRAYE